MSSIRAAILPLTYDLFEVFIKAMAQGGAVAIPKARGIPADARVTGVANEHHLGRFLVRLESPNFGVVPEGYDLPYLDTTVETGDIRIWSETAGAVEDLQGENQFLRNLLTDKAKERDVAEAAVVASVENEKLGAASQLESLGMNEAASVVRSRKGTS